MNDSKKRIIEKEQNVKNINGLQHYFDTIDKIFAIVNKLAGEVTTYRGQQELNSNTLSKHDDRIETIEKHLNISPSL